MNPLEISQDFPDPGPAFPPRREGVLHIRTVESPTVPLPPRLHLTHPCDEYCGRSSAHA